MRCPQCDGAVGSHARYCPHCGNQLTIADAVTHAGVQPDVTRPSSGGSSSGWLTSSDSINHGRFAPGAILDGRYRVIGLLGRGGMGEVYRADDLRLGQPVALKFLPDAVAGDPVRLAQFHNEVRTARQVSHPNVCRVYDIGEIEGHLFLSMEFVDGEDLASLLRRLGRFAEDKAVTIARQLCAGLAAAHERNVIHRDLKPANVMLDDAGNVRVMDFGLAVAGAADDQRVGTPAYMAPEQLLGKPVTARSDIYALGLVLYELFTGRRAFTATTLNDLVEQHQSGTIDPPSAVVSAIDPAVERAIMRCLDPDPARRPSSALSVAAALPGGDPLAAALAAGETPSPQMVAAAGEGAGLGLRVATAMFAAILIGIAACYALAVRSSPVQYMRPEMNADVLAQKAREAIRVLGQTNRPHDEAFGFGWSDTVLTIPRRTQTAESWQDRVLERPSPLLFWYRRSDQSLTGITFHHDLLTPGIVTPDDPPPIRPGMIQVTLDHYGLLTGFEAIPPQVEEPPASVPTVDWTPVLMLAGIDPAELEPATPKWNWLTATDSRVAWTGTFPGSGVPLRVEAAALHGRPVALQVIGPATRPWRQADTDVTGATAIVVIYLVFVLSIVVGGIMLAAGNLRAGRGDRSGALRLAAAVVGALWVLWLCSAHFTPSVGLIAMFLLAIVTTVFYGVIFWTIYIALEPPVRRNWPQTLVSWTTILTGRIRDPIVGRDVLVGMTLGVLIALLIRGTIVYDDSPVVGAIDLLSGTRRAAGFLTTQLLYAVRSALLFFYLLFLLRLALRNQWAAAFAFAMVFAALDALDSEFAFREGATSFVYFAMLAAAVLHWGLTTLTVSLLVANLLLSMPATTDWTAWYAGGTMLVLAICVGLAGWATYVSVRRAR
jgi:serine/threonine-protein kinase